MKISVLDLKPTQFALGLREVSRKAAELKAMSHDERHDYLRSRPVPVVISAKKHLHLVDHHHLTRACWEIGVEEIPVEIKADLGHLSTKDFWDEMRRAAWVHLHDQFGAGPHPPQVLPEDIRGLADDPYRSLAWALRHSGYYDKTEIPFAEFLWADFLRKIIVVEPGDAGFRRALAAAEQLASSPKAKHLPGWRERRP